ncbi:hypothetical protein [Aestuariivivens marinum]|uniref:hypothetical protein n=1 Tax=Aestuariivivens marinum TaxID=2913555 RepID=UPI00293E3E4A|nr:hypothetical protein [Aestuariivivens marinum]
MAIIIGKPIRNEGIKKPYKINRIHPIIFTRRNFLMPFIVKESSTIKDAKYPTYSNTVIPNNSINNINKKRETFNSFPLFTL